jgi:hypothetical protein
MLINYTLLYNLKQITLKKHFFTANKTLLMLLIINHNA